MHEEGRDGREGVYEEEGHAGCEEEFSLSPVITAMDVPDNSAGARQQHWERCEPVEQSSLLPTVMTALARRIM